MSKFNLSAWAVGHRSLVGFLIALIFIAGALSYTRLGRGEDPIFTVKLMVVSAVWPGASADETQMQLADPIERKLQDMAYLDHIDTFSRPGAAALMVVLRDDTPPAQVPALFYQVRKKLDDLRPSLPAGAQGPFVNDEYTDVYGAVFALTAENLSDAGNAELVRQADFIIAMTSEHLDALYEHVPDVTDRSRLLDPDGGDLDDPIGTDRENYLRTARIIEEHLKHLIDELGV